jgi:predicted ester cyclase
MLRSVGATGRPPLQESTTARNKATLMAFLEDVWNAGDANACAKYIAARYTIHHDPGDPWHGQTLDVAGFRERLAVSRAPFPDQRFDVQHIVGEGDTLACAWHWSGTHLGPLGPFSPTGRRLAMTGTTFYFFDDGLICGHWQVVDRLGVYQQLQQPPTPASAETRSPAVNPEPRASGLAP